LALLQVGFAPVLENVDYHWEIFLWGDPPLKVLNDFDLVRNELMKENLTKILYYEFNA